MSREVWTGSALRLRGLALAVAAASVAVMPRASAAQQVDPSRLGDLTARVAPDALAAYREFLSLPNVAGDSADIHRVLSWLEGAFGDRGFRTERLEMPGNDALLAERAFSGAERTALVYLQADGQPVDPSAWSQESPWSPVLKERTADGDWREIPFERVYGEERNPDWRIFARSASDSKGPIAQFLAAVSAMDAAGVRPELNLKVIVDTEEELGSPHLADAVRRYRDRLAADWLLIFDGPPHASGRPTLVFGARGIATATLTTYGPRVPQHSGHYGNYVPNPVFRLARLLATMKDERGRVTLPGWYDGVEIDEATLRVLEAVPDDEADLRDRLGIAEPEAVGGSLQEAIQYPSLNVRGIRAGWIGEQARTIIPARATAEIDVRLVAESDPDRLLELVREHVRDRGFHLADGQPTEEERRAHPKLASFEAEVAYAAYRTPVDSEPGRWLADAYEGLYGEPPIRIRTYGGSVPISPFVTELDVPAVSVPTVNPDNNQHSPDENIRVGNFVEGIRLLLAVLTHPVE